MGFSGVITSLETDWTWPSMIGVSRALKAVKRTSVDRPGVTLSMSVGDTRALITSSSFSGTSSIRLSPGRTTEPTVCTLRFWIVPRPGARIAVRVITSAATLARSWYSVIWARTSSSSALARSPYSCSTCRRCSSVSLMTLRACAISEITWPRLASIWISSSSRWLSRFFSIRPRSPPSRMRSSISEKLEIRRSKADFCSSSPRTCSWVCSTRLVRMSIWLFMIDRRTSKTPR